MSSPNLQKGKRVGSEGELLGGHELHSEGDRLKIGRMNL